MCEGFKLALLAKTSSWFFIVEGGSVDLEGIELSSITRQLKFLCLASANRNMGARRFL